MNPSLPPKKRESRQGSSDQRPPEDDFKYPAPLRIRRHHLSEGRESESRGDKDLLPPPPAPPPPPLQPLPLPLPWQLPYHSSLHHPYFPGQVRDRRGSGSPSWRDGSSIRRTEGGLEPPVPHHSRWLRGDVNPLGLHPSISVPAYKGAYAVDSRNIWPYYGHTHRDYASTFFTSSSHLYHQPSIYHHDILSESRLRYPSRRPNGLDGQSSRPESSTRAEAGNDTQPKISASKIKNNQEELARRSARRGFLSTEGTDAHSFLHDTNRNSLGISKPPTPHVYTSESRTEKPVAPQEPSIGSASQSGAQIYYALGSLYPSAHRNPQAVLNLNPSGPPPSPLRNSQHSPHGQPNSHGVDQERERSVSVLSGPDLPTTAVLPHFAKGSLIELAGGHLKRVEELRTEDFLHSADTSPEFHLSTCTILLISPGPADGFNHLQVLLADRNTQELLTVLEEYPFFVRDRGWSSCSPQRSAQLYGLHCRQLGTGDVCLALTPTPTSLPSSTPSLTLTPTLLSSVPSLASSGTSMKTSIPSTLPLTIASSSPKSTSLQQRSCSRTSSGLDKKASPPAPPTKFDLQWDIQDKPRPRKRRWSAPELQEGNTDLPQGYKQVRPQ